MKSSNPRITHSILIAIAIGVWFNVLQGFGLIGTQKVKLESSAKIYGTVDVNHVKGLVDIGNTVDINIRAINGKRNAFYQDYDGEYIVLPVLNR